MHLLIVSAFDFGSQAPVVARHRALLKGWVRAGIGPASLVLLNTAPADEPQLADGVRVFGVGGASVAGWRVSGLRGLQARLKLLAQEHCAPDAALLVDRDPVVLPVATRMMHRHGATVLHEITEFPDVVARPGLRGRVEEAIFRRIVLNRLDGVLCISPQLCTWVRMHASVPVEHVGGFVDLDRFEQRAPVSADHVLVGYCGSLDERKDGVGTLVRAVARTASPLLRLRIIAGPHSPDQRAKLDEVVTAVGLDHRVDIIGPVPPAQIPGLLSACDVLALPRPVSRQAEGGFPTKLGEYLATGRPVVASAVGSIPREITAGIDALLVPPGDEASMAAALADLARDANARAVLGDSGRERAERDWSPERAARAVARLVERVRPHG